MALYSIMTNKFWNGNYNFRTSTMHYCNLYQKMDSRNVTYCFDLVWTFHPTSSYCPKVLGSCISCSASWEIILCGKSKFIKKIIITDFCKNNSSSFTKFTYSCSSIRNVVSRSCRWYGPLSEAIIPIRCNIQ